MQTSANAFKAGHRMTPTIIAALVLTSALAAPRHACAQRLDPLPTPPPPPPPAAPGGVPPGMLEVPTDVEPPFDPFPAGQFEPTKDWGAAMADLSRSAQGIAGESADAWPELMAVLDSAVAAFEAAAERKLRTDAGTLEPTLNLPRMLELGDATPDEVAQAAKVLVEMEAQGVWSKLDALAKAKGAARPALKGLIAKVPLVDINNARHAARAVQWAMRTRAAAGDWDGFAAALERGLTLGRLYLGQAGPREFNLGAQICEMMLREVVRALGSGGASAEAAGDKPSAAVLTRCLAAVQGLAQADAGPSIAALRMVASDGVERCFPREVTPNQADVRRAMRAIELLWARLEPAVAAPPAKRDDEVDKISRWAAAQPPQLLVINIFGPEAARVLMTRDLHNTLRAGVATMLAIEARRASDGKPPESLEALTPEPLKALAADPFSAEGKPLRYRVLTAEQTKADPIGRAYLLYSLGADAVDDRGQQHPDFNEAALGRNAGASAAGNTAGTDYLINPLPRRVAGAAAPASPSAPAPAAAPASVP